MKIAIDISPLQTGHGHRGVGTYTKNLVKALQALDTKHEFILTKDGSEMSQARVVHYPFFDFFFLSLPIRKLAKTVVTIHDTIPLVFPDHYKPGIRGNIKLSIQKYSLGSVNKIVTDSNCSTEDVISYLHQPASKVETVYLAPDESYQRTSEAEVTLVRKKYSLSKPYILYVGDINYNKNIPMLLKAFSASKTSHQLVLVSKALANQISETIQIQQIIKQKKLSKKVQILTNVDSAADLQALYSGADWYMQPSLYEGFGLPVLEAMKCGTPVICSNGGSLKEIISAQTITFDPTSKEEMVFAITKALAINKGDREKIVKHNQSHVSKYTWKKTALRMLDIYESIS